MLLRFAVWSERSYIQMKIKWLYTHYFLKQKRPGLITGKFSFKRQFVKFWWLNHRLIRRCKTAELFLKSFTCHADVASPYNI